MHTWDVFVSHASEDKETFAQPLAEALQRKGLRVWFDNFTLRVGDSLRKSIDSGLSQSHYGVVILSPAFLSKEWPQKELNGLVAREVNGQRVILPVWHNLDLDKVVKYSPILADRVATSSKRGIDCVVADLLSAMEIEVPPEVAESIEVLDEVERHMLILLYSDFGLAPFTLTQVAEKMTITDRFLKKFDGFIHRGYVDKFLEPETRTRRFRLSPSLDYLRLQSMHAFKKSEE